MIALEVAVLERMIFDVDGEPLVGHVVGRASWHCPGREHAVHLEPEVVVQLTRGVLVDDEQMARDGRDRPHRLRGAYPPIAFAR